MHNENNCLDKSQIKELILEIKKKKELSDLEDNFVSEFLQIVLKQENKLNKELLINFNPRSNAYKKVIKIVRSKLRRVYGLFRQNYNDKEIENKFKLLNINNYKELIPEILKLHSSTKERLDIYPDFYSKLFKITKKPKIIFDFGCGLNPLSIVYNKLLNPKMDRLEYYAYDLNEKENELLNHFFKIVEHDYNQFLGKAGILDVLKVNSFNLLPKADICLLFKMTDVFDKGKGHKNTEMVLKNVPSKYVVLSFPTLTMSGKKMNVPQRNWVEWLCQRLGYKFKLLNYKNEIFYVIKKF